MLSVMKQDSDPHNPMRVGGQAVIEGVMMRAPGRVATSVRRADGTIESRVEDHESLTERYRPLRLPVIRGAVGLLDMLFIGIRTLNYSAAVALMDAGKENGNAPSPRSQKAENARLTILVGVSLLAGVALFFATPLVVTSLLFNVQQDPLLFNLIAGGIRVALLLCYLGGISTLKDVRRLFEYHGAEHKAIFAYEAGAGLDVASAARQSRFHPRCGTSFLLVVMLSSIILFGLLDALLIMSLGGLTLGLRLAIHLPLIPLVGGVSYEFIRISARHSNTMPGRIVVAPGLWLQKITTKEPDAGQLEVALAALRCALGIEQPSRVEIPAQEVTAH
jgi:uncharacterized protein YqhQ